VIDVTVLAGCISPEHDISLQSGGQVLANLDRTRYRLWPVHLQRDGMWAVPEVSVADASHEIGDTFPTRGLHPMLPGQALGYLFEKGATDVVFPLLHGPFGEDGTVQGMLDLHGVRYVGSGCAASATAMDKVRTRECLTAVGVPMSDAYLGMPVHSAEPAVEAACIADNIGFPCFLKTDQSGSSLGVALAKSEEDVVSFLREAKSLGRRFLAEELVQGEEISVPVIGNSGYGVEALPPIGIYPIEGEFFDYAGKYDPAKCEEIVPPRGLDAEAIERVQALAITCHEALQCDGLSRTDMIVTNDGPVVLEVNTMPGFTAASLFPKSAAAHGISYSELLDRLIDLSLKLPTRKEILS
jgi:D-alanine-D-alanine ligase